MKRISLSAALDAIAPGFEVRTWALLLPLPPPPAGRGAREAGPGPGLRAHRGRGERSVLGQAGGGARGGRRCPLCSHGGRGGLWGAVRRVPRGAVRGGALPAERSGSFGAVRSGPERSPPCGARRALPARARRSALAALGPPRLLRLRPPPMSHHLAVTLSQRRRRFAAPGARDRARSKSGLPRRRRAARAPGPTSPRGQSGARRRAREGGARPPSPQGPRALTAASPPPSLRSPCWRFPSPGAPALGILSSPPLLAGFGGRGAHSLLLGAAGVRLSRAQETGEALSLLVSEGR